MSAVVEELRGQTGAEIRFDNGSRALYSTDGSVYRQIPIGVVIPKKEEDVIHTVAICRKYNLPVLPRGAGTSLAGQCCNVAVVIDISKYMRTIFEIDPQERYAWVQPGVILDQLRQATEQYHLTFAPDPATHDHNTLGGMIGNNSCGIHSVMGGRTSDNIEELDILTYDGLQMRVGPTDASQLQRIIQEGGRRADIYQRLDELRKRYAGLIRERFPDIPRRVSGYNLDDLLPEKGFQVARALVGSEGTCVTVLRAKTRLLPSPEHRVLLVLGYPDVYSAGDHIPEILEGGPVGLEGIDDNLVLDMEKKGLNTKNLQVLPDGGGWLLVEFGGATRQEGEGKAHSLMDRLRQKPGAPSMKLFSDPKEEKKVWEIRESGLGATARVPGEKDTWPGWEDSAVRPDRLGGYLRDLRRLLDRYGYMCALYGHFGQACVHTRIDFDLLSKDGIENYRKFTHAAADLVLRHGGSFSGEHGDGQARGELLPKMFGPELMQAFREFKTIWDPDWKMNPGKVIDAKPQTSDLRLGTDYNPHARKTVFSFREDKGSFPYATLRCVGVGKCRGELGGTMCPSYMATREELHCTRGRARMLFEMFQGDVITAGWKEKHVKEALDLCLSCKSCKGECPVNVDMAKYKAEFLHHYYRWRLRPADAYTMGLIYWWSQAAATVPQMANFFLHTRPFCDWIKQIAGISTQRDFPPYARTSFRRWFQQRGRPNPQSPLVILWADTFNNHFYPEVAKAAVHILESGGFQVHVPAQSLCCGRPLFDYGMLSLARKLLGRVLAVLRPFIREGIPVIGLEPVCLDTFRDELLDLFPHDYDAARLAQQSFLLSEFLVRHSDRFRIPKLRRKALVHGHCTHKAVMKMADEEKVLSEMGLDYEILDSGCCGISGAFGFRRGNYDHSMAIGERVLLPAVRKAAAETLIIADGFSCREQIAQSTQREALHLAQVYLMATQPDSGPSGFPERMVMERPRHGGKRQSNLGRV